MTLLDFWRSMLSDIHHPDLLQISIDRLHRGLPAKVRGISSERTKWNQTDNAIFRDIIT